VRPPRLAAESGAEIKLPPTEMPGLGRFCVMLDPQGAAISFVQLDPAQP
jgi:predicted enzyme related to lactoylglutathione lyase